MVDAYNEEHQHHHHDDGKLADMATEESNSVMDEGPAPRYDTGPSYTDSERSSVCEDRLTPSTDSIPTSASVVRLGRCQYCGKTGPKTLFYGKTKKYCTLKCQRGGKAAKENFKKKPTKQRKSEISNIPKPSVHKVEKVEKVEKLPAFKWNAYLQETGAEAASVTCFKHVPMFDCWENITVGIKVEVTNSDCELNQEVYWIATVVKIAGYNAKLRYEGFGVDSTRDFWMNLCSEDMHPVGWCATRTKPLVPPQSILHKYVDWKEFLVKRLTGARTLPLNFYDKVQDAINCTQLRPRMRVEVVDKMWVSAMRVAQVAEVHGGRCRLQYEASSYEDNDFWIHEKSPLVHFVGWSESVGHKIHASSEYRARSLKKFLNDQYQEREARPEHFDPLPPQTAGAKFEVGMKLEAVDPLNLSAICPATVMKVLDKGFIMIGVDGQMAANGSDWFALHSTSPVIFPVGHCEKNNIAITPPKDYVGKFSWSYYLDKSKSQAAPDILFQKVIPKHGFIAGMKMEAVDLMEPRLICVASVARTVGRLIRVHFDGWDSTYDQWLDCQSSDIYPVGWCEMIGYSLEGPPNEYSPDVPAPKKASRARYVFGKRAKRRKTSASKSTNPPSSSQPSPPPERKIDQSGSEMQTSSKTSSQSEGVQRTAERESGGIEPCKEEPMIIEDQ